MTFSDWLRGHCGLTFSCFSFGPHYASTTFASPSDAEDDEEADAKLLKFTKTVCEFETYIRNNQSFLPNYGDRYRNGERISTAFVESTVNLLLAKRFSKKQQMRWSKKGAHRLLQVRIQVFNNQRHDTFKNWYPNLKALPQPEALAA
jgi:hypothetical protein